MLYNHREYNIIQIEIIYVKYVNFPLHENTMVRANQFINFAISYLIFKEIYILIIHFVS